MSRLLLGLISLVLVPVVSPAARADTISTFSLNAPTPDGSVSGIFEIDTTTGQGGYGAFTLVVQPPVSSLPALVTHVSGVFEPTFCIDCFDFPNIHFLDLQSGGPNYLYLEINGSLIGYTGGALCHGAGNACNPSSSGSDFVTTNTYYGTTGELLTGNLVLVSTAQTPEPGTLALLGTGMVGVFGVARRRLLR